MAYLCQRPLFRHVLQGPTARAFAEETRLVPAVAYKHNHSLNIKMAKVVDNTGLGIF